MSREQLCRVLLWLGKLEVNAPHRAAFELAALRIHTGNLTLPKELTNAAALERAASEISENGGGQ